MAYVNMTLDGQTKKTTSLNLKGADGSTKVATLEAILEASDIGGSGIDFIKKEVVPQTDGEQQLVFTFDEDLSDYKYYIVTSDFNGNTVPSSSFLNAVGIKNPIVGRTILNFYGWYRTTAASENSAVMDITKGTNVSGNTVTLIPPTYGSTGVTKVYSYAKYTCYALKL